MDFKEIEKKWRFRWTEGMYEPKGKGKKYFLTVPYPYVNGAPHVGHAFTFLRTDVYARFKRMQGFDVLFPQSFHATGEPLLGAIERLKQNDPVQISTFRKFGASDSDIERFKESPLYAAKFWMTRWISDLKIAAFSVDWSRTFMTATPHYNKFVEWQYNTLKKKGFVVQGTHPVIWCPHDMSPTGDHDRLEGEGESPIEYTLLKFPIESLQEQTSGIPVFLLAGTLRPETVYGATNIWIREDVEYAIIASGKEFWVLSKGAVEKLKDQLKDINEFSTISGAELAGKRSKNPVTNADLPILPARFVDMDFGTGIVMSVPGHAPYDWICLKELAENSEEMERLGVEKTDIEPVSIITVEGFGDLPAAEICEKMKIISQGQTAELDKATSELYKKEFHTGILLKNCGAYGGRPVMKVKEHIVKDFKKRGVAESMFETTGKVVCRCTTRCHVKILENQWFLKYSDKKWKAKAKAHIRRMLILPEEARNNLLATIDWLEDKACARKSGLGTPLPWDKEWIVETLSDSTIYQALYTIFGIINENKIKPDQLTHEFFDYISLGKGAPAKVSKQSKIGASILKKMRAEFNRWYPVDMRLTGKDLIQNHLAFYILQHIAIWSKKRWPAGIGVNGHVTVEGEKMSKSKGNVLVLKDLIEQHGADLVRINIVAAGEDLQDANWSVRDMAGYRSRLEFLHDTAMRIKEAERAKESEIDKWLLSVLQKIIGSSSIYYENLQFRSAVQSALFDCTNALRWYLRRCGSLHNANKRILERFLADAAKMLSPITPHACEEIWHVLGKKPFVSQEIFPKSEKKLLNRDAEANEEFLKKVKEDVENVKRIVAKKVPKISGIKLYVARTETFKSKAEKQVQLSFLQSAGEFLGRELQARVEIIDSDKSMDEKSQKAAPEKPGILIE